MQAMSLGKADLEALAANPTVEVRANVVGKVADYFNASDTGGAATSVALDILRLMSRDKSIRVRRTLSSGLCTTPFLPHDVAVHLAKDLEQVALPMITQSPVLGDEDLVDILAEDSMIKQVAVASRPVLSDFLAGAIADTGNSEAVATLVGNAGADIREGTFDRILDSFGDLVIVQAPLSQREQLPERTVGRLYQLADEDLQARILERYSISDNLRATFAGEKEMQALAAADTDTDVAASVDLLHRTGKLTPLIVLRAACEGNMAFVAAAFACLADIEPRTATTLLQDRDWLGLRSLLVAADIEPRYMAPFRIALETYKEAGAVAPSGRLRHAKKVLTRFLSQPSLLPVRELEEFITLLRRLEAPAGAPASMSIH